MSEIVNSSLGKYVKKGNLEPVGVCDRSGFYFSHTDLHKQMEWRGNNLVWTGAMVGTPFLDEPQEQNRPPLVQNDPEPVINPRPSQIASGEVGPSPSADEILVKLSIVNFYGS